MVKALPYYCFSVAVLHALAGMGLGVAMGLSNDYTLAPAHAHNNLLGWVGMAIFGLFYAVMPEIAARRLAAVQFWLSLAGNLVLPLGIGLVVTGHGPLVSIIGTVLVIAGMLVFAYLVWTSRAAFLRRLPGA